MSIRPLNEASDAVPFSVRFVRDQIRTRVRASLPEKSSDQPSSFPAYPRGNVRTIEDVFVHALAEVDRSWTTAHVDELIAGQCKQWQQQLPDSYAELREELGDTPSVLKAIRNRFMGRLEELRVALPEAWDTLLALASERQLQAQLLLRHWAQNFPSGEEERLDFTAAELQLFLDCSLLQKFMDHAYAKQRWLADRPGGTRATKLGRTPAMQADAQWIYEVIPSGSDQYRYALDESDDRQTETRGFGAMFPFEWPHMTKKVQWLAEQTSKQVASGALPPHYRDFVSYLRKMHTFFVAQEHAGAHADPRELGRLMAEAFQEGVTAYRNGCRVVPVMEATPSVAGDANKQDIGMRFGIVTAELQRHAIEFQQSQSVALERYQHFLRDQSSVLLSSPPSVAPVLPSLEMMGSGFNLHFRVGGTNDLGRADVHPNFIRDEAREEKEQLEALFPEMQVVSQEAYQDEALRHYANHEQGHSLFPFEDPSVCARTGYGEHAEEIWILEELKAEAESSAIRSAVLKQQSATPSQIRDAFAAKLGSIVTLVSTSAQDGMGSRYFFSGLFLLHRLMESGVLVEDHDHFRITDPVRGLAALASTGDEVIERYYADPQAGPEKAFAFVAQVRDLVNQPQLQRFIRMAEDSEE